MPTRSQAREKNLGYVLQCDIEEDLTTVLSIRKNDKWLYITVDPKDIDNDHLRGQFERRASACRKQQIAYQRLCDGEDDEAEQKGEQGSSDSGYSSDETAILDGDAEDVFREWIQEPLHDTYADYAPEMPSHGYATLTDWYATEIRCFSLKASSEDKTLQVAPREDLDGEAYLRDSITPNMSLPKYLKEHKDIDWFSPEDIEVLAESHDIHMPIHPTMVRARTGSGEGDFRDGFLKLAAKGQEPAVKRELKLLADIKKKGLYTKGIRAPKLEGIVSLPSAPDSHQHCLGFILSLIPQPCRPLTKLMTSEISQAKRKRWAAEVEKQVKILHDHELLWGDVKADNFLVDRNDELWIIDFGGSYTVGWMDPDKYLTKQGEREATKLIVDGVKDPDHCTEGLVGETDEKPPSQSEAARQIKTEEKRAKRKASSQVEDDAAHGSSPKRRR